MKRNDLRKKSKADLTKLEAKLKADIASFKIDRITKDEKNYKKSRNMRRELAQVLTVLKEEVATDKPAATEEKSDGTKEKK